MGPIKGALSDVGWLLVEV